MKRNIAYLLISAGVYAALTFALPSINAHSQSGAAEEAYGDLMLAIHNDIAQLKKELNTVKQRVSKIERELAVKK